MKRLILIIIIFLVAGCGENDKKATTENVVTPVTNSNGEILFKANCASCHKIDKNFTAPALRGSLERWTDKKAMYDFIRNSAQSENAYAKAIKQKWAPMIMTSFNLSDAQLDSIMDYISKYDSRPVAVQ
ncbi:MAG: cytochrome c [Ferruginibacter sp.]